MEAGDQADREGGHGEAADGDPKAEAAEAEARRGGAEEQGRTEAERERSHGWRSCLHPMLASWLLCALGFH